MKKIIITLSLVMLLAIFTSGCRPVERPVPDTPRQTPQYQTPEDQMPEDELIEDELPQDRTPDRALPGVPPGQQEQEVPDEGF